MTSTQYIGMDVHKESISIAVMNDAGKIEAGKTLSFWQRTFKRTSKVLVDVR
jgi:hypothetical protein